MNGFVDDGRVHYLGASNRDPNAWQVAMANEIANREGYEPFTNTQIIFNLVNRQVEPEFLPMVESYGLGLMPFSPLAGGFLTGKYERDESPPAGSRGDEPRREVGRSLTYQNTVRAVETPNHAVQTPMTVPENPPEVDSEPLPPPHCYAPELTPLRKKREKFLKTLLSRDA